MDIFEGKKAGWLILSLQGRMDAVTAPLVRDRLMSVIDRGDTRLLLDCTVLDYVSSAGLRVLFEAAYRIQDLSGQIACYGVSPNVLKIFNLADLGTDIQIYDEQGNALQE